MNLKETLRPFFERLTAAEYKASNYISKGKEKTRLGFLPDALVAGGFAAGITQNSIDPIILVLSVRIALVPLFLCIGWFWKRSGAWDREARFVANLTPQFRILDAHNKKNKKSDK